MRLLRITLAVVGAVLALAAAGCGGSSDVPEGAVAVVGGTEISRAALDELLEISKRGAEAQKQEFPKVGTPEYQTVQKQWVAVLVQREELRQEAEKLGIEVAEKDVDKALEDLIKDRYDSDRKEFEKALKQQGYTESAVRDSLEASLVAQKLFEEVTKDAEVTDDEILAYYTQNQAQYESVDYARSKTKADEIYAQLKKGANFAELARTESADTGTASSGGKYVAVRGQSVPEFDKVAFELETGEISRPVKTQFGYHVIQATSPIRPAKGGQPESRDVRHILISEKTAGNLDKVKESIRQILLQERRGEVMRDWLERTRESYESKVAYAEGFEPPELPDAPTETE